MVFRSVNYLLMPEFYFDDRLFLRCSSIYFCCCFNKCCTSFWFISGLLCTSDTNCCCCWLIRFWFPIGMYSPCVSCSFGFKGLVPGDDGYCTGTNWTRLLYDFYYIYNVLCSFILRASWRYVCLMLFFWARGRFKRPVWLVVLPYLCSWRFIISRLPAGPVLSFTRTPSFRPSCCPLLW